MLLPKQLKEEFSRAKIDPHLLDNYPVIVKWIEHILTLYDDFQFLSEMET